MRRTPYTDPPAHPPWRIVCCPLPSCPCLQRILLDAQAAGVPVIFALSRRGIGQVCCGAHAPADMPRCHAAAGKLGPPDVAPDAPPVFMLEVPDPSTTPLGASSGFAPLLSAQAQSRPLRRHAGGGA